MRSVEVCRVNQQVSATYFANLGLNDSKGMLCFFLTLPSQQEFLSLYTLPHHLASARVTDPATGARVTTFPQSYELGVLFPGSRLQKEGALGDQ